MSLLDDGMNKMTRLVGFRRSHFLGRQVRSLVAHRRRARLRMAIGNWEQGEAAGRAASGEVTAGDDVWFDDFASMAWSMGTIARVTA